MYRKSYEAYFYKVCVESYKDDENKVIHYEEAKKRYDKVMKELSPVELIEYYKLLNQSNETNN